MHDLAVLRKQARQTRSFPRLGPRRACAVAFERTLRWNSFGKPESSRMRRKSVSKRKLIFQVPMVRIHFPPAVSQQTFGSSQDDASSAPDPTAVLLLPVLLNVSAASPTAVFSLPSVLPSASNPMAVLPVPVVLLWSA